MSNTGPTASQPISLALLSFGVALLVTACAGRLSVKEQYLKRSRDVSAKYDAMVVPGNAELVGAGPLSCSDFIDKLKSKYTYWKPGEAGTDFCRRKSTVAARRDFEMHARTMHNKGISVSRSKRLAHLQQLYKEAAKVDAGSSDEAPVPRAVPAASAARRTVRPQAVVGVAPVAPPTPADPKLSGKGGELLPYADDDEQAIQSMEALDADEHTIMPAQPAPAVKRAPEPAQAGDAAERARKQRAEQSNEYEAGDELRSGPLSEYE